MTLRVLAPLAVLALAGCGAGDGNTAAAPSAATEPTAGAGTGVIREEVQPEVAEAPVTPMPAQTALQSQPGPDGGQVDLLTVRVTGDILTVTFRCSSEERINSQSFRVADISVIDDATAQRIAVLKDNQGKWLASNAAGDYISTSCETRPGIFWAKFPAPPATSQTVSINLPETAPFDGVPVTR